MQRSGHDNKGMPICSMTKFGVYFDVDEHPGISDAKQMARASGIKLAISNPCFELWLLLHFREQPGPQNRHRIQHILKTHVRDSTRA